MPNTDQVKTASEVLDATKSLAQSNRLKTPRQIKVELGEISNYSNSLFSKIVLALVGIKLWHCYSVYIDFRYHCGDTPQQVADNIKKYGNT